MRQVKAVDKLQLRLTLRFAAARFDQGFEVKFVSFTYILTVNSEAIKKRSQNL